MSKHHPNQIIDCACVIHGTGYNWDYVERLYNMLTRNLVGEVRMHVYTEHDRSVPPHMVKHILEEWPGISGPKKSWWYKMQLFNSKHHQGNLLYLDLDVVILKNLNWIVDTSTEHFWTIRDYRYLQNIRHNTMNSSLMWWNVKKFDWVWDDFSKQDIANLTRQHHGDQDYLQTVLTHEHKRMFDINQTQSWRWQVFDGGYDFRTRQAKKPGTGATVSPDASILVFHGRPKPHQVLDPVVIENWR